MALAKDKANKYIQIYGTNQDNKKNDKALSTLHYLSTIKSMFVESLLDILFNKIYGLQ